MSAYLGHPPPGVESDWSRPGYANSIRDLCIAMLVFNTIFVAARTYTRSILLKNFGVDDCFCILAYGMTTAQIAFHFVAIQYGFGRHIYDIPAVNAKGLYKNFFILGLLPGPAYCFIKLTFFLTYARIFTPEKYIRIMIWAGVAVTCAFYIGDFFYDLFQCQPIAKAWDPLLKGHCAKEAVEGGPTGIFNVISDIYIFILPLPVVWSLHMDWKRKLRLYLVFSLGLFTIAMSVSRLGLTIAEAHKTDFTYTYGLVDILANLEWSVGLMVACMLVYPALWDRLLRKMFADSWLRLSSVYQSATSNRSDRRVSRNDSYGSKPEIHKTTYIAQEAETV